MEVVLIILMIIMNMMNLVMMMTMLVQSLEAFWPGVLSMVGDTEAALKSLHNYHQVGGGQVARCQVAGGHWPPGGR